ncbi:MAG: hypothetical protein K6B51_00020 [Bacilli bacterium]|nr:hypothetical protein [Bacilli bacterium]
MKGFRPSKKLKARLSRNSLVWAFTGLLVFSASVMATSGLAWFTVSNSTYVQNLTVSYGGEAFRISRINGPAGANFEPTEDQKDNIEIPGTLISGAVSSMFTHDWYNENDRNVMNDLQSEYDKLQKYQPNSFYPKLRTTYGDNIAETTRTSVAKPNVDYISFTFDFTNNQDTFVYLADSTHVIADEETNEAIVEDYGNDGSAMNPALSVENLNKAVKAVRISFLSNMGYKIFEPNPDVEGESTNTRFAGRLDVNPWDGYYDTNSANTEILYGDYDERVYSILENRYVNIGEHLPPKRSANSFLAEHRYGCHALTDQDIASLDANGLIAHEKTYTLDRLGVNYEGTKSPLLFIKANTVERVVISIYCEGWDLDCTNAAYLAAMKVHLGFSARYAPYGHDGKPIFTHPAPEGD